MRSDACALASAASRLTDPSPRFRSCSSVFGDFHVTFRR